MALARTELVRGHVLEEGLHSQPGGSVVVQPEGDRPPISIEVETSTDVRRGKKARLRGGARLRLRSQAGRDVGTEASAVVGSQHAKGTKDVLLVSSDDAEILQSIQAFVVLLQKHLAARQTTELERLIEILEVAMPALSVRQHPAVVEQACRNVEFRAEFLKRYDALDAEQVDERSGSKADDTAELAHAWRNDGKIFGVERQGRVLYPAFQFGGDGRPKPVVADILQAIGKRGPWQIASWFDTPNGWLSGDRRPVDVMDTDPDAVVNAAREVTRPNLF